MMERLENWALHAYLDGELDAEETAAIERRLAGDPNARTLLDRMRQQGEALHRAYDGVLDEPVPPDLLAAVKRQAGSGNLPYLAMAASLALLLLGGAGGWLAAGQVSRSVVPGMAEIALEAHQIYTAEVRHPVEVTASEQDHLQAWLSKRVGHAFIIPDLSAEGYTLLGGRLLVGDGRPAGQLMYEDASKRRLTIFITSQPGNTEQALRVVQSNDLLACYWLDGHMGFALAGDMARDRMMKLADEVYRQMEET